MLKYIRIFQQFLKKVEHDYVNAFSALAALFIIISAFPIIMMLLSLIQFVPLTRSDLLTMVVKVVPDALSPLIVGIMEELYQKSSGAIFSLSALATLWSASRGTLSIVKGLNSVYNIEETRNYFILRIVSCFYTIAFILIIIFSLMLLVFGNSLYRFIAIKIPLLKTLASMFISMRIIFSLSILMLFFMFIYKVMPNRKSSLFQQVPGALFSSAGWMLFSYFFSIYIDNFNNFSYMYGSLTTIVLLMLWLYICMYILFLGGEINAFFEPFIQHFVRNFTHKSKNQASSPSTKK